MARLNVNDARCEALFASALQRSDAPTAGAVAQAISRTVRQLGTRGCASQMAQEFGDHPEVALDRMRWVRQLIGELSAAPAPHKARRGGPEPGQVVADRWLRVVQVLRGPGDRAVRGDRREDPQPHDVQHSLSIDMSTPNYWHWTNEFAGRTLD